MENDGDGDSELPRIVLKVVLCGDNLTQRVLLLLAYTEGAKVGEMEYIPTIFDNYVSTVMINDQPCELALFDTAGQEDYDRLRPLSYPQTDVFILCFSVVVPKSFENIAEKWVPEVRHHCPKVPILLVGVHTELRNKSAPYWDERYAEDIPRDETPVTAQEGFELAKKIKAAKYLECSARTHESVKDVFLEAIHLMLINNKIESGVKMFAVESRVKMFIVGNPGVGKSTLTKALKTESKSINRVIHRFLNVSGVIEQTAGIVPHDFSSKYYGNVTLYDFAGHREFYASHDALIRNAIATSSSVVFLVVIPLTASDEEFKSALLYWLCFLENQCPPKKAKPCLILVASQYDKAKPFAAQKLLIIEQLIKSGAFSSFDYSGHVTLDCRKSESKHMLHLRDTLSGVCSQIKISSPLSQESSFLFALLYRSYIFSDLPAVTLEMVAEKLKDKAAVDSVRKILGGKSDSESNLPAVIGLPWNEATVADYCKGLDQRGHILYIENEQSPQHSRIILQRSTLLQLTATIFAPEGFKEYRQTATATGLVPFSKLASLVPGLDPDMVVQFLCHLDFCHEVSDPQVISLLHADPSSSEKLYFFPELVSQDMPKETWLPSDQFDYHSGWVLQCANPEQFLMPRLLQVLLLRIAFQYAFKPSSPSDSFALPRNCTIWKTGVSWSSRSGVEALVEVRESNTVLVLLRCFKSSEMNLIRLRSSIISTVLETQKEFCPRVVMQDYLVPPTDAHHYPPSQTSLVSFAEIVNSMKENEACAFDKAGKLVKLDELLFFEPYMRLGVQLLEEIFNDKVENYCTRIRDESIFNCIADKAHLDTDHFVKLFNPSPSRLDELVSNTPSGRCSKLVQVFHIWKQSFADKASLFNLRNKLNEFSIFARRNPLSFASY